MCSSGSSPWIPGSRFPLSVNVSTCHHAAVSSQHAGFFWNIQRVAPPTQLNGGEERQHRWRGRQQVLRALPSGDKRQLILHCENALLCQCSMLYDLDIAPPPSPLQTHRNTAAVKLQPEVTLQVKSFSPNLRSTVKVATMRLQGPHAIYRDLALRIPSSHPPPPSFSPHLPTVSSHVLLKLFSLEATEWQTRSEVLQCDRKDVLFSVPAALSTSLHFFLSPGGNKWGQISSFLLCNLIRALTLDAAYRAGGESLERRPS